MKIKWRTLKQSCENEKVISMVLKNHNTHIPWAHPVVSHFTVTVNSYFGFNYSADYQQKETFCGWKCSTLQHVSWWLSWEFSPSYTSIATSSKMGFQICLIVYTVSSNITFHSTVIQLIVHVITALHEPNLMSLWWQLMEQNETLERTCVNFVSIDTKSENLLSVLCGIRATHI